MNTLVLLHGALGAKDQLDPLLKILELPQPVESITLAGHGEYAGKPETGFGIEFFALELLDWMEKKGLPQIDVFGYSMGGYVALWLALKYPEKVGKVMTLATKLNWSPDIAEKECRQLNPEKMAEKVPAFAQQLAARHGEDNWKQVVSRTAGLMQALGRKPLLTAEELPGIGHEVLIGIGDKDGMVSLEESITAFRMIPRGKLAVLPGTLHPLEKVSPQRLSYEIADFFR